LDDQAAKDEDYGLFLNDSVCILNIRLKIHCIVYKAEFENGLNLFKLILTLMAHSNKRSCFIIVHFCLPLCLWVQKRTQKGQPFTRRSAAGLRLPCAARKERTLWKVVCTPPKRWTAFTSLLGVVKWQKYD
jgi:hypothetical protein